MRKCLTDGDISSIEAPSLLTTLACIRLTYKTMYNNVCKVSRLASRSSINNGYGSGGVPRMQFTTRSQNGDYTFVYAEVDLGLICTEIHI